MIIKKFQAKTESEAVENARKELGPNVVIMNVRSAKKKGIFSFFSPQLIEVTVALEDETDREIQRKANNSASTRNITEALGKVSSIVEKSETEKPVIPVTYDRPTVRPSATVETSANSGTSTADSLEKKLDSLSNLLSGKLTEEAEKADKTEKIEKTSETKEVSSEKEKVEEKSEKKDELKTFFDLIKSTLEDNEVAREYSNQIVDEIAQNTKTGTPFDVALASIYQKLILKFGNSSVITPAGHGPKVVFFVGPTGVGKTTTIAKIASTFSVIQKKKIALLTADTYRIAAAEQLRTYANILEVPFRIIYTIEEMEGALDDFRDFDYVLVDTAGHSHQNSEQKNIMGEFIHSVDGSFEKEVYLVVSSTTKYRDLKSIADAYSEITEYKLIFTKLDETTALGNLLNLKLYTNATLSYVTCGQNVPDDIDEFNAQNTVKQLLGGKK